MRYILTIVFALMVWGAYELYQNRQEALNPYRPDGTPKVYVGKQLWCGSATDPKHEWQSIGPVTQYGPNIGGCFRRKCSGLIHLGDGTTYIPEPGTVCEARPGIFTKVNANRN